MCIGCNICVKKCPFEAISIINLPSSLDSLVSFRYDANSFKLHRLPSPRPGQVLGLVGENGTGLRCGYVEGFAVAAATGGRPRIRGFGHLVVVASRYNPHPSRRGTVWPAEIVHCIAGVCDAGAGNLVRVVVCRCRRAGTVVPVVRLGGGLVGTGRWSGSCIDG